MEMRKTNAYIAHRGCKFGALDCFVVNTQFIFPFCFKVTLCAKRILLRLMGKDGGEGRGTSEHLPCVPAGTH